MDLARARMVLGVDADTEWRTVREQYRRKIRAAHPDVEGGSTERASRLNVAFAVLVRLHRSNPPSSEPQSPDLSDQQTAEAGTVLAPEIELLGSDTLFIGAPADEAFQRVLAGLDLIGTVTSVDRTGPIAEAFVVLEDGTTHSLLVTFQGRTGGTEVLATLEAIESVGSSSPMRVLRTLARFIPPN